MELKIVFSMAMVIPGLTVIVAPVLIGSTTMSKTRGWNEKDDQPDQESFHKNFHELSAQAGGLYRTERGSI